MNILLKNFDSHISSFPHRTKGMVVSKKSNLTLVDSGLDSDTFNIIHILNGHNISDLEIQAAINHFERNNRKCTIWIAKNQLNEKVKSILASMDVKQIASAPGLKLELTNYKPIIESSTLEIKIISSAEELKSYALIIGDLWTPKDENVIAFYDQTSRIILENIFPIHFALCYIDEKPVAGIEMCATNNVLGIYGLVTLEAHRKQGIGTALMHYALTYGKSNNLDTSVLHSSDLGYGIYKKLGFKIMTEYFKYQRQIL